MKEFYVDKIICHRDCMIYLVLNKNHLGEKLVGFLYESNP